MSFLKQLRRRSKASFHTPADSKGPSHQVEVVSGKSSSTIDTSSHASITPPSSIKPTLSSPNLPSLNESNDGSTISPSLPPPTQRPGPFVTISQRNSIVVCIASRRCFMMGALKADTGVLYTQGSSSSSINGVYRSPTPSSPYAPRIISIADNSWVSSFEMFLDTKLPGWGSQKLTNLIL
jgi:hypothetical protein